MKVIEVTAFGGPDVLRVATRPDPVPATGEVVVRIRAASVSPADIGARSAGKSHMPGLEPPFIPGWDLAGVVSAVGSGVGSYKTGDRVCGMIPFGATDGATLPLNSLTAHQALEHFSVRSRQSTARSTPCRLVRNVRPRHCAAAARLSSLVCPSRTPIRAFGSRRCESAAMLPRYARCPRCWPAVRCARALRTRVARAFPLDETAEAHRVAEQGGLKGKVVLRP